MEGRFIGKVQRQKYVDEIKKSHFQLGNYCEEVKSEKRDEVERVGSVSGYAKLMRATNFDLGTDKSVIVSESTSRFKPFEIQKSPYIVPDVSIDLRKTHYSLGSYKQPTLSTAHSAQADIFTKTPQAEIIMTADSCQAHHYAFGTDKPKTIQQSLMILENSKEETQALKKELQKTHFVIGSEKPCYETTTRQDFTGPKSQYVKNSSNLQKEHFKLGTDRPHYDSIYKTSQQLFRQGKKEFKGEVLKDLRNSHFVLGNIKPDYLKTSQDFAGDLPEAGDKAQDEVLRKTNFTLGNFNQPLNSTYKSTHSSSQPALAVSARDRNSDKITHFTLGNSNLPSESIHRTDFKILPLAPASNNKWGEYLRSAHFDLGKEKPDFESQNKKYGKDSVLIKEQKNDMKNDLRTSHFLLGNDKSEMLTTSQKAFKNVLNGRSVQSVSKVHGKHSHRDGNGVFMSVTEQRSRFNWIQPVTDNNFKFSLEKPARGCFGDEYSVIIPIVGMSGGGKEAVLNSVANAFGESIEDQRRKLELQVEYRNVPIRILLVDIEYDDVSRRGLGLIFSYYRGAKMILAVYDTENLNSFEDVEKCVEKARRDSSKPILIMALSGDERKVCFEEGIEMGQRLESIFIEVEKGSKEEFLFAIERCMDLVFGTCDEFKCRYTETENLKFDPI